MEPVVSCGSAIWLMRTEREQIEMYATDFKGIDICLMFLKIVTDGFGEIPTLTHRGPHLASESKCQARSSQWRRRLVHRRLVHRSIVLSGDVPWHALLVYVCNHV